MHLTAYLGGIVFVVMSQQEQSMLFVVVCAGLVKVQAAFSRVVTVVVQATSPAPPPGPLGVGVIVGVELSPDGEQLVTVVVPGEVGAGVGHSIMQMIPVVVLVSEHPLQSTSTVSEDAL